MKQPRTNFLVHANSRNNKHNQPKFVQSQLAQEVQHTGSLSESNLQCELAERLGIQNIYQQHAWIQNMNSLLQIRLQAICAKYAQFSQAQILASLSRVPFLKILEAEGSSVPLVQLMYKNANQTIVVTGIKKDALSKYIQEFCHYNKNSARLGGHNAYWHTIQCSSEETTADLKRFLRKKKKNEDINETQYKVEKKRVRIIVLKQDFYTILVDAMTQERNLHFNTLLRQSVPRDISEPQRFERSGIFYCPIRLATQAYSKEDEIDNLSEDRSRNSQLCLDNKKLLEEVIQTSDMGIQASNNNYSECNMMQDENPVIWLSECQHKTARILKTSINSELHPVENQQNFGQNFCLCHNQVACRGLKFSQQQRLNATSTICDKKSQLKIQESKPFIQKQKIDGQLQYHSEQVRREETVGLVFLPSSHQDVNKFKQYPILYSQMLQLYQEFKRSKQHESPPLPEYMRRKGVQSKKHQYQFSFLGASGKRNGRTQMGKVISGQHY